MVLLSFQDSVESNGSHANVYPQGNNHIGSTHPGSAQQIGGQTSYPVSGAGGSAYQVNGAYGSTAPGMGTSGAGYPNSSTTSRAADYDSTESNWQAHKALENAVVSRLRGNGS